MATLIPKLTLTSNDPLSDSLDISTKSRLTITDPHEFSRRTITTASLQTLAPSNTLYSYIYIHVVSSTTIAAYVDVTIGDIKNIKLRIDEFLFLPIYNAKKVEAQAVTANCVVEYGYWSIKA